MNLLKWFRMVSVVEGLSFLTLLLIAMPLKYYFGMPIAVRIVGMAHGMLFLLYLLLAFQTGLDRKWSKELWIIALVTASLPFGFVYLEKRLNAEAALQS